MNSLEIRLLNPEPRAAYQPVWQHLEAEVGGGMISSSWDWTDTWMSVYADRVPVQVAVGLEAGGPRAITLVTRGSTRYGPFKVGTIHLGTAGEPEEDSVCIAYNHILARSEDKDRFMSALVMELTARADWRELHLDGFSQDEMTYLSSIPMPLVAEGRPCLVFDFRRVPANEPVRSRLRPSIQKKLRSSLRSLGAVETEWATTVDGALDIFRDLAELNQEKWRKRGRASAFSSRRFCRFHRDLIPRLLPKGRIALFRTRAQGRTLACLYGFIENRRLLSYQSGVATLENRQVRAGLVTDVLCMEAARERGILEYDFLVGDSPYKRDLSTDERSVIWGMAARPGGWPALLRLLRRARRGVKKWMDGVRLGVGCWLTAESPASALLESLGQAYCRI